MPCPLYQSRVAFVRDVLWLDVGSRRFLGAYQKATPPLREIRNGGRGLCQEMCRSTCYIRVLDVSRSRT